jgi:hypothetical protein
MKEREAVMNDPCLENLPSRQVAPAEDDPRVRTVSLERGELAAFGSPEEIEANAVRQVAFEDLLAVDVEADEVAIVVLHHLTMIDMNDAEMVSGPADGQALSRENQKHWDRINALDGHLTPELKAWVVGQRKVKQHEIGCEIVVSAAKEATSIDSLVADLNRMASDGFSLQPKPEDPPGLRNSDETMVSVGLTREEIAAIALEHLKNADWIDWISYDPQDCDTFKWRQKRWVLGRANELTDHIADCPVLIQRVKDRREQAWRKIQTDDIIEFLGSATSEQAEELYQCYLKLWGRLSDNADWDAFFASLMADGPNGDTSKDGGDDDDQPKESE